MLAAAVDLGRSVKWIEDRNEHLLIAGQAREETLEVEAALRDDGTLLGMRVHMTHGPGRVPGVPVQRRDVPAHDPHHDPGAVPPSRARVLDHADRIQQGHLRRLPRTLGGGDLGTRAAARHRRPRAGHRSRRDPPPQHDRRRRAARGGCSPVPRSTSACRRARRSSARSRSPTSSTGPRGRPRRAPRAASSASGSPRSSRRRRDHPTSRRRSCRGRGGMMGGEPAARGARGRRHRVGVHPADAPRSGSRDDARPGRGRRARRAARAGPRPLRRHEHHAVRLGRHRWEPLGADGRGRGHVLGARVARTHRSSVAADLLEAPKEDLVIERRRHPRAGGTGDLGVVRRRRRERRGARCATRRSTTAEKAAGRRRRTCAGSRST